MSYLSLAGAETLTQSYADFKRRPLFVEILKANLSPSEIPIEAPSDVVEAWLRLFHVFDNGNEDKESIFQDLIQGLKVKELSDKYQTGQLYLKWDREMKKVGGLWGKEWSLEEMSAVFEHVLQTQNFGWFNRAVSNPFW